MMTTMGCQRSERRHDPRVPLARQVDVRVPSWSTLESWGYDLSLGGIRLSLPEDVRPGDQVAVALRLPNGLQFALCGEVRHVAPGKRQGECIAGLRFIGANADELELLRTLVSDLVSSP